MTITLQPDQERAIQEAIRAGAFRSVDEFIDAAIAALPNRTVAAKPAQTRAKVAFVGVARASGARRTLHQGANSRGARMSDFIADASDALRHKLDRGRRAELHQTLQNPHPESADLAELGFEEWIRGVPEEDAEALVDRSAGKPVRWVPGEGWVEGRD